MTNSYERVIEAWRNAGLNVIEKGKDNASAQAPGHSEADLSISIGYNGDQVLLKSFADEDKEDILKAVGLTWGDLFDNPLGVEYKYPDGRIVKRTVDKNFYQSGNKNGDALYHADRLANASTVYLVGGEKDVHTLEHIGFAATCNAGGEKNLGAFDLTPLHGKRVVVVRDRDAVGVKFAQIAIHKLAAHCDISVVTAKSGKDSSDHIVDGFTVDDFVPDFQFGTDILIARVTERLESARGLALDKALVELYKVLDASTPMDETAGLVPFDDLMLEWWEYLEKENSEADIIPSPWPELNEIVSGGFHRGRSYLMAARPGAGKSLGLTNFGSYAGHHGYRGAIYSVEMGRMEVASRIVSAGSKVEYSKITQRKVDGEDLIRIAEWADNASGMNLWVCDQASVTMNKIRRDCRSLKAHGGLDFVCVDYLQLLKPDSKGQSRQEQISEISRNLKLLAKELDIAVISACQLNRGNVKDGRPPTTSDLRESGSLEQDCDVAILLHHETHDGLPTGDVEFIVGKNRTGKQATATLQWRAHFARIGS